MKRQPSFRWILLTTALVLATTACGSGDDTETSQGVEVIATTTVLGDIAANVVGDAGTVTTLIPVGASPHDYQTSAQQAAAIQQADLVLVNGLGLEEGLTDVIESARADGANVLEIGPLVDPIPFGTLGEHEEEAQHDHEDGTEDPHFWLDPHRDAEAARLIAEALTALDGDEDWGTRAEAYADELATADQEIEEVLASIPIDDRKLVTNHDSLSYFAQRYGFEVVGVVIPGGSTLAEPSSTELSDLVDVLEQSRIGAIFGDTTEPSALAEALAAEIGEEVAVVDLYTGSLGEEGSDAATLIEMLKTNARRIADALT